MNINNNTNADADVYNTHHNRHYHTRANGRYNTFKNSEVGPGVAVTIGRSMNIDLEWWLVLLYDGQ